MLGDNSGESRLRHNGLKGQGVKLHVMKSRSKKFARGRSVHWLCCRSQNTWLTHSKTKKCRGGSSVERAFPQRQWPRANRIARSFAFFFLAPLSRTTAFWNESSDQEPKATTRESDALRGYGYETRLFFCLRIRSLANLFLFRQGKEGRKGEWCDEYHLSGLRVKYGTIKRGS